MGFNLPLIIFAFILLMYLFGASLILYHLRKFGIGMAPKAVMFIYIIGSAIFLSLAVAAYNQVPWDSLGGYTSQDWTSF